MKEVDGRELMKTINPKKYMVIRNRRDNSVLKVFRQSDLTITREDKPDDKIQKSENVRDLFEYREQKAKYLVAGEWYADDSKATEALGYNF